MNIVIRNEKAKDFGAVEVLVRESFWNLYSLGCVEHLILHNMRDHKDYIEELSFVIEVENEIVGYIGYTKSKVISAKGKEVQTLTFGPVCINPKFQRRGLGRKLITHSIEKAKELGFRGIVILGYPYHYETYGFTGGKKFGICMGDGNFYKGLLVLPLYEDSLKEVGGVITFSNVFEVTEEEVLEFDKKFEFKEKYVTDSQREYEETAGLLDEGN